MSLSDFYQSGAILNISPQPDGSVNVSQQSQAPPPSSTYGNIDWSYGPVTIIGGVNPTTWDTSVQISILGINLGTFNGNLQQGVSVNVDLMLATGTIKLYLKGSQVWASVDISIKFNGKFQKDVCVFPPTPVKALL